MYINCVILPEITVYDPLASVLAGARLESLAIDDDGRLQIAVDFDGEDLVDHFQPFQIGGYYDVQF